MVRSIFFLARVLWWVLPSDDALFYTEDVPQDEYARIRPMLEETRARSAQFGKSATGTGNIYKADRDLLSLRSSRDDTPRRLARVAAPRTASVLPAGRSCDTSRGCA